MTTSNLSRDISFADLRDTFEISPNLDDTNVLRTDGDLPHQAKFIFNTHGNTQKDIQNCVFEISSTAHGHIRTTVSSSNSHIKIGRNTKLVLDIRLWRNPYIEIGDFTTINKARIVSDKSDVIIGNDCMFSDEILIQSSDQHGIWDVRQDKLLNSHRRRVEIGHHVWVGRRATIMPDISIGDGSIIGTGAVVTKSMPECVAAVGIPAEVVREGVSWSRNPNQKNEREKEFFQSFDSEAE